MSENRKHIRKIIRETLDDRQLGNKLSDEVGKKFIVMYRAVGEGVTIFKNKDYVTLSKKFAVEHAENNHVYYEEPQQVIQVLVSTEYLYNASNPGEYFYSGDDKKGKVIYITKGNEYEGWDELTSKDFISEGIRKIIREIIENIMTISEFSEEHDDEICEAWLEINKTWLIANSGDNEKWEEREFLVDDFENGGQGFGNYEACWNDEDPELGYDAAAKIAAQKSNITLIPDIEGIEYGGDGEFFMEENSENIEQKTYVVNTSEEALQDEMYDAQGEKQQFLSGDESEELLFGDYTHPEIMKLSSIAPDYMIDGYKMMISKQGKYGLRILNSLKKAMKNGNPIPPITVWREGQDKYSLISGRHRVLAAHELGYLYVPVIKMYWRDKWED